MTAVLRACIECGELTRGSRCPTHQADVDRRREARQGYRPAYSSALYRRNRPVAIRRAGGQCQRILSSGLRCSARATEVNHIVPLSTAPDLEAAIALCRLSNLEAVCSDHNPRGGAKESA